MMAAGVLWLSVPEAARRTGVPERTLRFWCARGWVASEQTPGGRYRVRLEPTSPIESVIRAGGSTPSRDVEGGGQRYAVVRTSL